MVWLAAMRTLLRAIEFGSFPKAAAGESPCAARTGSVAALLANASLGAGLFLSTTFEILSAMPETASCQRADLMPNEIVSSFGCSSCITSAMFMWCSNSGRMNRSDESMTRDRPP